MALLLMYCITYQFDLINIILSTSSRLVGTRNQQINNNYTLERALVKLIM